MLEARNLQKTYRSGKVTVQVLKGVSLQVERGAFVAIMGPSGAGKSTLLHLLAGLDTPSAGEVLWDDRSLSRMGEGERARLRNHAIGIIFQFYHLMPELTTLENVMLPALVSKTRSTRAIRQRAVTCLEQVGLRERMHHRPGALSGGELQRAAIARALVNEPQVMLCDEPTGNLDSKTGEAVAELLRRLHRAQGMSLVLVTHEAKLAQLADRTMGLRDGRIVEEAPLRSPAA